MSLKVQMGGQQGQYTIAVTCPSQDTGKVLGLFQRKVGAEFKSVVVNQHHQKREVTVLFTLPETANQSQALSLCTDMERTCVAYAAGQAAYAAGQAADDDWEKVGGSPEQSPARGAPVKAAPRPAFPVTREASVVEGEDSGTPVGAAAPSAFPGTQQPKSSFVTIWHEDNAIFIRGPEAQKIAQYVAEHCPKGVTVSWAPQHDGVRILCTSPSDPDRGGVSAVMEVAQKRWQRQGMGVGIVEGKPRLYLSAPRAVQAPPSPVDPTPAPPVPQSKKTAKAPRPSKPESLEVVIGQQGPGLMFLRGGGASAAAKHLEELYSDHRGVKLEVSKGMGNERIIKLTPRDPKDTKAVSEMAARIVNAIQVFSEERAIGATVLPTEERPFVAPLRQGVRVISSEVKEYVEMLAHPKPAEGTVFEAWLEERFDPAEVTAQAQKYQQTRVVAAMQLLVQKCCTGGALAEALKAALGSNEGEHTAFREACRSQPGLLEQLDRLIPPTFIQKARGLLERPHPFR